MIISNEQMIIIMAIQEALIYMEGSTNIPTITLTECQVLKQLNEQILGDTGTEIIILVWKDQDGTSQRT